MSRWQGFVKKAFHSDAYGTLSAKISLDNKKAHIIGIGGGKN